MQNTGNENKRFKIPTADIGDDNWQSTLVANNINGEDRQKILTANTSGKNTLSEYAATSIGEQRRHLIFFSHFLTSLGNWAADREGMMPAEPISHHLNRNMCLYQVLDFLDRRTTY